MISKRKIFYPLLHDGFNKKDIKEGMNVLASRQITMSKITKSFEKNFAKNFSETGPIELDVSILRRAQLLLKPLRFRQCKSVLLMQALI